jgi:hypothetical protein
LPALLLGGGRALSGLEGILSRLLKN